MTGWVVPGLVHVRQVRVDPTGMRVVARQRMNRRIVAVTYLSQEFLADTEFRNRFMVESVRLAQVRDFRVARVRRYVECGHGAAVVADHVEGIPLRALLLEEGALGTEAAVVVLKDALGGLATGHAAGLVHGDVKPEDVVLTRAGRVRLVDFGLSTCDGRLVLARSTPFYLAPEQWSGRPGTPPADLYAATATFFECLVGAPPFHADSPAALSVLHECSAPPLDAVPAPVRQLVQYGLAKDPVRRPSAERFLAQVEEVATQRLGRGWERRGRRELTRLLAGPARPPGLPVAASRSGDADRERRLPVRLGVVLGGALVLAAGLTSPPSVLLPKGPGSFSDSVGTPPAQAHIGPPNGTAGVWADGEGPRTDRARDARSASMTGSVGLGLPGNAQPGARVASAPATHGPQPEIASDPDHFPADAAADPGVPSSSTSAPAPPSAESPTSESQPPAPEPVSKEEPRKPPETKSAPPTPTPPPTPPPAPTPPPPTMTPPPLPPPPTPEPPNPSAPNPSAFSPEAEPVALSEQESAPKLHR